MVICIWLHVHTPTLESQNISDNHLEKAYVSELVALRWLNKVFYDYDWTRKDLFNSGRCRQSYYPRKPCSHMHCNHDLFRSLSEGTVCEHKCLHHWPGFNPVGSLVLTPEGHHLQIQQESLWRTVHSNEWTCWWLGHKISSTWRDEEICTPLVVQPTAETKPREGDGFIHISPNQTKNTKAWCDCPLLPHPLISTCRVSPVLLNKCTDYCYVLHVWTDWYGETPDLILWRSSGVQM